MHQTPGADGVVGLSLQRAVTGSDLCLSTAGQTISQVLGPGFLVRGIQKLPSAGARI